MRESFVFYRSFYEAIKKIKDKATKADIYEAICELGLNKNVIPLTNDVGQIIMELVKPQIEANTERYENGKKGGAPIGNQNAKKQLKTTTGYLLKQPNENDNENVNDNDNVNVRENSHTLSLTLADIVSYGLTLGISKSYCERFYEYYEGIGWVNGNGLPIKNWKLVLSKWYKKDKADGKIKQRAPSRRLD